MGKINFYLIRFKTGNWDFSGEIIEKAQENFLSELRDCSGWEWKNAFCNPRFSGGEVFLETIIAINIPIEREWLESTCKKLFGTKNDLEIFSLDAEYLYVINDFLELFNKDICQRLGSDKVNLAFIRNKKITQHLLKSL